MYRADLIRGRRQALGVPPAFVAAAIKRSTASLYLYETGAVIPPIPVLEDIADALDMDIAEFFRADAEQVACATAQEQGLPPTIADPTVLAQIAALLVAAEKRGPGEVVPDAA